MASLHLVHAGNTAITACLDVALPGDAIVLLEDAVYVAAEAASLARGAQLRWHVLGAHVDQRGIGARLPDGVARIDWDELVDLVVACERSITWV